MAIKEYGYEYDAVIDNSLFSETRGQVAKNKYRNAFCLRCGRDALKMIARDFQNNSIALLPALSCDSMSIPFELYGIDVLYYPLNKDLSINFSALEQIISLNFNKTILFLHMDYFGIRAITDEKLEFLRLNYNNLIFINDITHILPHYKFDGFGDDFVVASIRKWIAIPDGGLLWNNIPLKDDSLTSDTLFSEERLRAQSLRNNYFKSGNETLKQEYRRIFSHISDLLDNSKEPCAMSLYSYKKLLNSDLNSIALIRKRNFETLSNILSKSEKIHLVQTQPGISDLYVPFLTSRRTEKQSLLNKIGIFDSIIWPLREEQKKVCENSKYVEEHMLAAPCDQRYSIEDMKYIGNEIARVFNE